jgi:hypothetical protein
MGSHPKNCVGTLKGLAAHMPNPFRVDPVSFLEPQGCRCAPTTGLKLANAFGVTSNSRQIHLLDMPREIVKHAEEIAVRVGGCELV